MTRFRADGVFPRETVANGFCGLGRFLFQFVSNFVVGSRTIRSLKPTQRADQASESHKVKIRVNGSAS